MNSKKAKRNQIEVSVVGAGIAGITTAFHLRKKGYKVNLIDSNVNKQINTVSPNNGTQAALGALMGNIYKRSKGRAFLLRKRSMKLWREWLLEINNAESEIKLEQPLIKLASSDKEFESMIQISKEKKEYGVNLLDKNSLELWSLIFEKKIIGGLISLEDGRLDTLKLLKILIKLLSKLNVNKIESNVIKIKKSVYPDNKKWNLYLENNECINQDYIVICSALNTQKLLVPLGHKIFLESILGQVVELELENKALNWKNWPAILNYKNINFIYQNPNHLIMGATIERNIKPNTFFKKEMLEMKNSAPSWIRNAKIKNEWHGIRAKPINEPAPLLKYLEQGLLINTGHYRNGILLAPYCAEWVGLKIDELES